MRVLITILLIGYVLYKFYKLFFGNTTAKAAGPQQHTSRNNSSDINRSRSRENNGNGKSYQGGEYIDYEEVS